MWYAAVLVAEPLTLVDNNTSDVHRGLLQTREEYAVEVEKADLSSVARLVRPVVGSRTSTAAVALVCLVAVITVTSPAMVDVMTVTSLARWLW